MPMHWYRRWQRGFNQAELLAKPVARHAGIRFERVLQRVRLGKGRLDWARRRAERTYRALSGLLIRIASKGNAYCSSMMC